MCLFFSTNSSYQNREFDNDIFPLASGSKLAPEEYIEMVGDVLRMNKNICLCRNFANLSVDRTK